jgi:hypothetical protein
MVTTVLDLFERITFSAKRLVTEEDLSDEEAQRLSRATDEINAVRDSYTTRKLHGVFRHPDNFCEDTW